MRLNEHERRTDGDPDGAPFAKHVVFEASDEPDSGRFLDDDETEPQLSGRPPGWLGLWRRLIFRRIGPTLGSWHTRMPAIQLTTQLACKALCNQQLRSDSGATRRNSGRKDYTVHEPGMSTDKDYGLWKQAYEQCVAR